MKKINLLFIINSLRLGGAEKLVYDIALALKSSEYNIFVLSVSKIESQIEISNRKILENNNITVLTLNKRYKRDRIKSIIKLRNIYRKYNIKIVHTHGQSPDFYGRLSSLFIRKIKLVTTIHNTKGYSKFIETILKNFTDFYTVVSNQVKNYATDSLGIKKKVRLIYNGIDLERYKNRCSTQSKEDIILSVGRIDSQKGYILAYERIKYFLLNNETYKWIILGQYEANNNYYQSLISTIEPKLKNRIIFKGTVSNTEIYYKKSKLFYLNSIYEGFGIVFLEALAAGIPMLVSNVGIIPELIKLNANINLIENNNDLIDFAKIINTFDSNMSKVNQSISEKFSLANIVSEYDKLYRELFKEWSM